MMTLMVMTHDWARMMHSVMPGARRSDAGKIEQT